MQGEALVLGPGQDAGEITRVELGVWAIAQVLSPTCCVTLGESFALSGLQFYLSVK